MTAHPYVYFFQSNRPDGNANMNDLLGAKGARLASMANAGLPVPPGFTISTAACREYLDGDKQFPGTLHEEIQVNLADLEALCGQELGDESDPLLLSVRCGAASGMPGLLDSVLNLGLNDTTVEALARRTTDSRFAWDSYQRFIAMYGEVVRGIPHSAFDEVAREVRDQAGVKYLCQLDAPRLRTLAEEFKQLYRSRTGEAFPQDPLRQLYAAVEAVFESWNNPAPTEYRELNDLTDLDGTAVNVQMMVFGNLGYTSCSGVAFTRNPVTGDNRLYGEYLVNAQGDDVVAGLRTPKDISDLPQENLSDHPEADIAPDTARKTFGDLLDQLLELKDRLEELYGDVQDFEFTVQEGDLYVLNTRDAQRTARAAIQIAVDMAEEGLIDQQEAISRVDNRTLREFEADVRQQFDPAAREEAQGNGRLLATGLPASAGAVTGRIALAEETVRRMAEKEAEPEKSTGIIFVHERIGHEHTVAVEASRGLLSAQGGMTANAAIIARSTGKPAVVGCDSLAIDQPTGKLTIGDHELSEGDAISLDGDTGEVYEGQLRRANAEKNAGYRKIKQWRQTD